MQEVQGSANVKFINPTIHSHQLWIIGTTFGEDSIGHFSPGADDFQISSYNQLWINYGQRTWTAVTLLGEESLFFSGPWEWLSKSFRHSS